MHDKTDDSDGPSSGRAALMDKIFFYEWTEEGPFIKKTLLVLLLVYLNSDVCDVATIPKRQEIAFHIKIIDDLVDDLIEFEVKHLTKEGK